MQEEKMVDIKGTFSQFIKTDEPELTQEEAIMKYKEPIQYKKNNSDSETDTTEEQEHLKRIKKELLASLERVNKMEQQIFKDREDKMKVRVNKKGKDGGFGQKKDLEEIALNLNKNRQKERD